jgi:tungsten cofactor oxidoreducase radical SAM maturase
MPKITKDSQNKILIPKDFLDRRHLPENVDYWLDEYEGDIILHSRLPDAQKLYIEATTGCNLQCKTCIRNVWHDPIAAMTKDTFQAILNDLESLPNLKRVIFTSFGEPLTHPNIMEMIAAIRKRKIEVTLGTNGLLLTPDISRELVRLGVDRVMVSIDGGRPETYEDIRGAMLTEIVGNIQKLNEIKLEMHELFPSLGVEFVVMKSNVAELEDVARLSESLSVSKLLVSNVLAYTEDMLDEILYGHEPVDPFHSSSWAIRSGAWVMWATQELPRMHWGAERRCRFIQDRSIVVGWDGEVSPCYALSHNYSYYAIDGVKKEVCRHSFGNVKKTPLHQIWMSENYVHFRSEVRHYHFPSCPDCDLRETCDLRKINEGCWGLNPSCADCLWAQDIVRCP